LVTMADIIPIGKAGGGLETVYATKQEAMKGN
jgi:hypothetical protein